MARTTCHDNSKCHIVNHDAGRDPIKCVAGIKPVSSRVIEHLKTDQAFHRYALPMSSKLDTNKKHRWELA